MEIVRTVGMLLRRPFVVVPLVVFVLAAGAATFQAVPLRYESKAIVVLTTPAAGSAAAKRVATNPLLDFGESLRTATTVTMQAMGTTDVANQLGAGKNAPNSFTVTDAENTSELFGATGPFLMIKSTSRKSPEAAFQTTALVADFMRTQLAERQRVLDAPRSSWIVVTDVVPPTTPEADYAPKLKFVGAALMVALLLGLGFAYTVHRLVERARWARREDSAETLYGQPHNGEARKGEARNGEARNGEAHTGGTRNRERGTVAPSRPLPLNGRST